MRLRRGDPRWHRSTPLTAHQIGGADLTDPEGAWTPTYSLIPTGATLIRPDGHIAWRNPDTTQPGPGIDTTLAHLTNPSAARRGP
ncbi:MAG: hypothetical protein ACRDRO_03580 [Pseudonocardiaceae bacterium]